MPTELPKDPNDTKAIREYFREISREDEKKRSEERQRQAELEKRTSMLRTWQRNRGAIFLHEKKGEAFGNVLLLISMAIGMRFVGDEHPGIQIALMFGVGFMLCYLISLIQKRFD